MMNPAILEKLKASIKKHEGFKQFPYHDTKNKITIGYGHNLSDVGLKESECDLLLSNDIFTATYELYHFIPWAQNLDDVRKAVMIEMTFNIGIEKVLQFRKLLDALQNKDYQQAAKEMLDSEWAKEVGNRAHDMAYSMESGIL